MIVSNLALEKSDSSATCQAVSRALRLSVRFRLSGVAASTSDQVRATTTTPTLPSTPRELCFLFEMYRIISYAFQGVCDLVISFVLFACMLCVQRCEAYWARFRAQDDTISTISYVKGQKEFGPYEPLVLVLLHPISHP